MSLIEERNAWRWIDWSVKDHVDEAERLARQYAEEAHTAEVRAELLALVQIHATLAQTKAQLRQTERGY
jgi:hypothetical protein